MLQLLFAVAIAQKPVVANAMESPAQDVKQEAADELVGRESHGFLLIVVAIVLPIEFHVAVFDLDNPMVGDGDSVRVAADIVHHLLWPGERWLGVDDPFHVSHQIEMTVESLRIFERLKRSEELQLAGVKGLLQILQEQSAEQLGEYLYRQKKVGAAGDPPGTIG